MVGKAAVVCDALAVAVEERMSGLLDRNPSASQ
jgi:hypothetical protein